MSHDPQITSDLAKLIAKRFIQRKDVKAIQVADGGYRPIREPWKMGDLRKHVTGEQTFGHYTTDQDGLTKVIVFDIDLDKTGSWVERPGDEELAKIEDDAEFMESLTIHDGVDPRELWHDRRHPSRNWYKFQFRTMIDAITSAIHNNLGFDSAAAYSGNKGCHVYAFLPEPLEASVARQMALITLEYAGGLISPNSNFEPVKGSNFFKHAEADPWYSLQNLTVEVFPKQDHISDLGNLVRLPLGKNLKNPKDPCFFVDQRLAQVDLAPHPDPVGLLESGNPFTSGETK